MWEDNYIRGLTLLPGTLAELGASAQLETVALEEEGRDEWDLDSVVDVVSSANYLLGSLEDVGFFLFLDHLSEAGREMRSVLAAAHTWGAAEVADRVGQTLRPLCGVVSRLAAQKAYGTLLGMKSFLEEVAGHVWGGKDCLEHLAVLHEHLGELQPGSCLNCLKNLHLVLAVHRRHLVWLSIHPLIERKLGRGNVFARLTHIHIDLEGAHMFLEEMQEILERFDRLQAIDLHD